MSSTRIVCTIGPKTCSEEGLLALREAGMSVARLNGSHADEDWHRSAVALIRHTLPDVPILLDVPGRKIRTGRLKHEPAFSVGERLTLTTDQAADGLGRVPVNSMTLHEDLSPGDRIFADDGTLSFVVIEINGQDIVCEAQTSGRLRSAKGINVPHVKLQQSIVTDRDRVMMALAHETGVDYVGLSFVESSAHIDAIRELRTGDFPRIVAKIENQGGLDHAAEVISSADAIMIDRGDLSVETSIESTAVNQKEIISSCTRQGKPVIVATEMLHSMIESPLPTKAEVSDITNAVLDGCAATMLSGETAVGDYPIEAVSIMRRISDVALGYERRQRPTMPMLRPVSEEIPELALTDAIALTCRNLPITKIIAVTMYGFAARMVASSRPVQPIIAVTNVAAAARSFNLYFGTEGVYVDLPFDRTSTSHITGCLKHLWDTGRIDGDDVILVTALAYPNSGSRMNMIETHHVDDLAQALGWPPRQDS
ncbi:MAG: pyruvate kinase [Longimicrobiales bacterium]|nr:pyruvate kinase [Longimicrobiales bacterium]